MINSLVLKTTNGEFIHIADVVALSALPFKDESGLVNALAEPADPLLHVWVKNETGDVFVIQLDDPFNAESMGIDMQGYINYNDSWSNRVQREIIEIWARHRYPKVKLDDFKYPANITASGFKHSNM